MTGNKSSQVYTEVKPQCGEDFSVAGELLFEQPSMAAASTQVPHPLPFLKGEYSLQLLPKPWVTCRLWG